MNEAGGPPTRLSIEERRHKARHEELHKSLDELVADYLTHKRGKTPSTTTVFELMQWSYEQTKNPYDGPRAAAVMHEAEP